MSAPLRYYQFFAYLVSLIFDALNLADPGVIAWHAFVVGMAVTGGMVLLAGAFGFFEAISELRAQRAQTRTGSAYG